MNKTAACTEGASKAPFWRRSLAWLLLLGPLFFLSYGYSNQLAAAKAIDHSIVFAWERHIPFLPWTIVPYWSIDLLYGLSFLLCRTRLEVDRHALRLLTAQIISVACFIAFPLHFVFERPQVDGFFGALFDALMDFDKPYNQAPSLHISLLVIIWARFRASVPQAWRITVNVWALLIGLSVLTTYQHHFIDVPTGVLVELFCVWLWPSSGASTLCRPEPPTPQHRKLALYYLFGPLITAACVLPIGSFALWLRWAARAAPASSSPGCCTMQAALSLGRRLDLWSLLLAVLALAPLFSLPMTALHHIGLLVSLLTAGAYKYLALRVAFDEKLFRNLARQWADETSREDAPPLAGLARLDQSLARRLQCPPICAI